MNWGPRNNVNMQQSALLIAINHVAKNKETFLENYYLKNKRTIERGQTRAPFAYVIPAGQRRRVEAAELMNLIRREGAEVNVASAAFSVGSVQVAPGDYIVRLDQPYGGVVETILGLQFYAPENPRPYDDTGWALPLVRNVRSYRIEDKAVFDKPMTLAASDFRIAGAIAGTGRVLIVDHTTDNTLVTFRFQHKGVKMAAAEREFEAGGHRFGAGAFIIADANRAALEPSIKELGLSAWAVDAAPSVPMHDLDLPRIGYVHTWTSTQDEGWVRLAFDNFKVPYTYFGAPRLREGGLKSKYDVIVFPHAGQGGTGLITGGVQGAEPRPYRKTEMTPNVGTVDSTDDMRGSIGVEGLMELYKFVQEGGVLITEGATSTVFPEVQPDARRVGGDARHPLRARLRAQGRAWRPQQPGPLWLRPERDGGLLQSGSGDARRRRGGRLRRRSGRTEPAGDPQHAAQCGRPAPHHPRWPAGVVGTSQRWRSRRWRARNHPGPPRARCGRRAARLLSSRRTRRSAAVSLLSAARRSPVARCDRPRRAPAPGEETARAGGRGGSGRGTDTASAPRVLLSFPLDPNDLLLSGLLVGGEALAGRAVAIDAPLGKGHVVMFANRPYWRWQTQGNFFLGFNAILNWNDLDAGRAPAGAATTQAAEYEVTGHCSGPLEVIGRSEGGVPTRQRGSSLLPRW